ncbi:DUF3784 domain-containing protein [Bacillus manliponensis]|uniref:DUF3784 domain-containing protein n=1 Tax=Bacillus manliponensis TaxID=574376 RepID=UPI003518CE06
MIAGFVVCVIVSLIMFLFGYLIWKKKKLHLIAGYNEKEFTGNKEKLAKISGVFSICIGILTLLLPFGLEFIGDFVGIIFAITVALSTIGVIIYMNLIQ